MEVEVKKTSETEHEGMSTGREKDEVYEDTHREREDEEESIIDELTSGADSESETENVEDLEESALGDEKETMRKEEVGEPGNDITQQLREMGRDSLESRNRFHIKLKIKMLSTCMKSASPQNKLMGLMTVFQAEDENTEKETFKKYESLYDGLAVILRHYDGVGYFVKIIDGDSEFRLNVEIVTHEMEAKINYSPPGKILPYIKRSNCAVQELFWTAFFGCHLLEQDISSTRAETRMRNKIKHQHSVNKSTDVLDNGK